MFSFAYYSIITIYYVQMAFLLHGNTVLKTLKCQSF